MRTTGTILLGMLISATTPAMAGELELVEHVTFTVTDLPAQTTVHVPQFDDLLGARLLTDVEVRLEATAMMTAAVENDSDEPIVDALISITGFAQSAVDGIGGFLIASDVTVVPPPGLAPSDGMPGEGPDFFDFGKLASTGDDVASGPGDPDVFVGDGELPVVVSAAATLTVSPSSVLTLTSGRPTMVGTVDVVYRYELTACAADLDVSGMVDFTDLLVVLSEWGRCDEDPCDSDIDHSGDVGFGDLLLVLASWSTPCP